MLGVCAPKILLISLVALVVFEPGKLAGSVRELGAVLGEAWMWLNETSEELASADHPDEWFKDHSRPGENYLDKGPAY